MLKKLHIPLLTLLFISSVAKPNDTCTNLRIAGATCLVASLISSVATGFTFWRYKQQMENNWDGQLGDLVSTRKERIYFYARNVTCFGTIILVCAAALIAPFGNAACKME